MSGLQQINFLSLIEKEEKMGYSDGAVFGGFAEFVKQFARQRKNEHLWQLAVNYEMAAPLERSQILVLMRQVAANMDWSSIEKEAVEKPLPITASQKLTTPVRYLKNIGPKRAALLQKLNIHTVGDLLFFLPRDYEDRSRVEYISSLAINQVANIQGEVIKIAEMQPHYRMHILKAWIRDESGIIVAIWFNQKFLAQKLSPGKRIFLHGKLEKKYAQLQFSVQDYELLDDGMAMAKGILPIYRLTDKLNQKAMRKIIADAWTLYHQDICDVVPAFLQEKYGFPSRERAFYHLHFPQNLPEIELARMSLVYEEFLLLQLALGRLGNKKHLPGIAHDKNGQILNRFVKSLPYALTEAQMRCVNEIYHDMESPIAMARLLQGDVGSGKTVVAAAALYKTFCSGYQGALMVPTELLANQHYEDLGKLLGSLGAKVVLYTGSGTVKEKKELLQLIADGTADIIIGTHALIQNNVQFAKLGIAITDEQHRFGVMQRVGLQQKGQEPDILVMTATPIPRTLSMTLYGDLQLSIIDELPPGRKPVKTYAVNFDYESRVWRFVEKEVQKGRQAYIVCPLLEESEKLDLQSASELAEKLTQNDLKNLKIALMHGKLKSGEKQEIAELFRAGKIDVLVATTVVEVGINVPNASVMVVKNAERFGLAQLHQLRGRIGRGKEESFCILLHEAKTDVARARMRIMTQSNDGFRIAEEDLKLRGPGEFFGTKQHGIPEMKVADLFRDGKWLEIAREDARMLLQKDRNEELMQYVDEKFPLWH